MNLQEIKRKKAQYEVFLLLSYLMMFVSIFFIMTFRYYAFAFILLGSFLSMIPRKKIKALSQSFKEHYVKEMLNKMIPDCTYNPTSGFDKDTVYASLILKREDRFHSEDLITGTLDGKHFECADVHLQDVRSTGKSTTVVTVFRGLFFIIDSKKDYKAGTYIMPNHTLFFSMMNNLKKMEMEYIKFNQAFDVFGADEVETFELIKPRFMERILDFYLENNKIRLGFQNNKIYISIDKRKDMFDLKPFFPVDSMFFDEIETDIQLIRELLNLI